MKKVSFDENKNSTVYYENFNLFYQEILDIIINYFTDSIKKKIKYRKHYNYNFKEVFDTIDWILFNYKNKEFDEIDVFFTVFEDIKKYNDLQNIKKHFINYDFSIFNKCEFNNFI